MVVKVQPVTPSLPATTAIQDPAVRRFAQSVADILRTHQSKEYAVQQLTKAAEGLIGVDSPGTPPSIRDWLASSDLYAKLASSIDRIDIEAKRAIIEEQEARVQAIADEAESRANEIALEIAARIAAVQAEADLRAQGLLAEAEARGAAIASEATVRQSEDESIAQSVTTLTSSVNNSLAGIEEELTTLSTNLGSEASERQTLAAQMRGTYTGNDLSGITAGLLYQERIARATADQGLAQQITLLSAGTGEQFDHFNIWYFDDGVEGWVGNGAPTVTGGWLRPANHATDPYVSSPAGLGAEGSTYSQVRVRVRKTGSPAWAGVLYWRGAADSTWDVARSASFPEPVFDANGIGLATVNLTWTGEIDRIRIDLSMAQTATDFFEIDWIAVGRPSPGASAAALLQEQIARASADAAEAASREALSVKLVGQADPDNLTLGTIASGLLYDEKLARSTADSTEVSKRESLSAKLTGFNDPTGKTLVDLSSGLIYEEKVARANEVEAVASTVTALATRMGAAESAITAEQTTRSNADSAMASSITGLTAQFGGNITYSVLKQFEFVSGVEGWVGVGATISNAGGSYLAMVTTAANPYISYTLPTADRYQGSLATKIRARIRRISGASVWEGRCYYTTAAHSASDSYRKVVAAPKDPATWTIVEWDMSALTNGGNDYATNEIRAIRLDLVSGAGDAWDIDWISIGEKVVSPASYDVQQVNAAITDEAKVRADADTATTSRISTMRSQLGVTEEGALVDGFILDERNTRASNDSAIVSAVNTALASITGVSNAISQSGENLVANWTSAQATKWNQIEAEVVGEGGNTIRAALEQESITRANADGSLGAQWTLKTDINGYISGFGFASTANNATPTSEFIIRADKFAVVMPGYGDYVPFAIGQFGPMLLDSGGFNVPVNDLVSASANPTSFLESFQSGNLAQWTNHSGSGELSVVSVSNSLTGGKVLRIGNNSGNDQAWLIHKQNIPFDPSALYRIKFRVRRTAGTGAVYLGLAGVAADGVTWANTSGANSYSGQHYVAANAQNPGSAWTEYVGYVKGTAATGQSGTNPSITAPLKLHQSVKYIRPLILANFNSVAGTLEVDYCSIELMTDAMSWDVISGAGKPEDGATVGAPAGTLVAGVQAANVAEAVTDFNASNNRNGAAITAPTILTNGTAVDHVAQKDGSVDISFEWGWSGDEGDIDGFLVYVRSAAGSAVYAFGTTPAEETVYTVPANKRAFILFGVAANKHYTFGVQAYRAVDKAINAAGVIKSALVKATGSGENPYLPSATVAFTGDVTGTIDGTLASTLVTNASTALSNANAAQADATDALDALADIAADNKLTPAEKKSVRKEWDAIYAERAGIRAQADLFATPPDNGITTAKANYDSDFQTLGTYLNGGVAYTIGTNPPSWIKDENLSVTTSITGTTFRNHWKNLYADRQALLNKIAVEASKRADWTLTAGKPDDEDLLNTSQPLNKNPDLLGAVAGEATAPRWGRGTSGTISSGYVAIGDYNFPIRRDSSAAFYVNVGAGNTGYAYWTSEVFAVNETKDHCLSLWARKYSSTGQSRVYYRIRCYDKDGVDLGTISLWNNYSGLTNTTPRLYYKTISASEFPINSTNSQPTAKVRIELYSGYQEGSAMYTRLMLNEGRVPTKNMGVNEVDIDAHLTRGGTSVLAADFVATWNKINSSNILTYMGPTAITEAVIGTAAISTAKIQNGAITTAKIGNAQIDSATIAGGAVTSSLTYLRGSPLTLNAMSGTFTLGSVTIPADPDGQGGYVKLEIVTRMTKQNKSGDSRPSELYLDRSLDNGSTWTKVLTLGGPQYYTVEAVGSEDIFLQDRTIVQTPQQIGVSGGGTAEPFGVMSYVVVDNTRPASSVRYRLRLVMQYSVHLSTYLVVEHERIWAHYTRR